MGKRSSKGRARPQTESTIRLLSRLSAPAKTLLGGIVLVGAAAVAWNQMGWWKPASTGYVDEHLQATTSEINGKIQSATTEVNGKVAVVAHQVDQLDTAALQNRLETVTAAKNRELGEQADLQLKLKLANDSKGANTDYIRMVQTRLAYVADQVQQLTNQVLALQEAVAKKNTAASK